MHPVSESRIGQILNPTPMSTAPAHRAMAERVSLEQIVYPRHAAGSYTGPERRVQGYLIADVIEPTPTLAESPAGAERQR